VKTSTATPTLAYLAGARPNFVKLAPVLATLRRRLPAARHVLIHTGQHYDREMADVFIEALGMPEPDYLLGVGSGTHGAQTARALERIEEVLLAEHPDLLVVPGDVNSTLAGALAAAKLQIPVAHLEAGLRSFDETMPEELNRVLVDRLSTWCFTHSPEAEEHLAAEGIPAERVHFVGNTMIDSLSRMLPRAEDSGVHERLGLERGSYLLVTLHRPKLVDGDLLAPTVAALVELAQHWPVVFPVHPRVRARLDGLPGVASLRVVDPVGYLDFLALEAYALGVITDSGGVQEETSYLGVPCFTVRENTERPVTISHGTNTLLGLDPRALLRVPELLAARASRVPAAIPGWDGRASERLADVLAAELTHDELLAAAAPA
jgi:UDP-N-acetylglucosamine 2-epimerase (non-hydrolysing)